MNNFFQFFFLKKLRVKYVMINFQNTKYKIYIYVLIIKTLVFFFFCHLDFVFNFLDTNREYKCKFWLNERLLQKIKKMGVVVFRAGTRRRFNEEDKWHMNFRWTVCRPQFCSNNNTFLFFRLSFSRDIVNNVRYIFKSNQQALYYNWRSKTSTYVLDSITLLFTPPYYMINISCSWELWLESFLETIVKY